jgi:hypothetical protein
VSESYEREKLANAVSALVSAAPIQKRLEWAWTAMHTLKNHGFTNADRQAEYESIYNRLTADKSNGHAGHVPTTTSRLSDADAEAIANDIVSLNTALNWNRVYELEDEIRDLKAGKV